MKPGFMGVAVLITSVTQILSLSGNAEQVQNKNLIQRLVSKENLREHLKKFFSKERNDKEIEEKKRVRTEIEKFYQNLRLSLPEDVQDRVEVRTQRYYDNTNFNVELNGVNIILTIKGTNYGTSEDQISLAGAHYDTTHTSPGVNDNGSGMAALLAIARNLVNSVGARQCSFNNSIILVAFDHEEDGLVGSEEYVKHLDKEILQKYDIQKFQGAFILETMMNFDNANNSQAFPRGFQALFSSEYQKLEQNAFRGDFLTGILRRDDLPLANILTKNWYELAGGNFLTTEKYRQINVPLPFGGNPRDWPRFQRNLLQDFFRSDHYKFWSLKSNYTQEGLKAVFITDTATFRGNMQECYHEPCDNFSKVNDDKLEFLQIGAEAVLRSLVTLSTGSDDLVCLYSFSVKPAISITQLILALLWLKTVS